MQDRAPLPCVSREYSPWDNAMRRTGAGAWVFSRVREATAQLIWERRSPGPLVLRELDLP